MSAEQKVIYAARTSQEAHLLKNLLADLGIKAVVTNELLERGSGVDIVGWPTASRVVVGEEDAPRARQIALELDRKLAAAAAGPRAEQPDTEPPATVLDEWPWCPQCEAPRTTRCPVCGTAGSDFALADADFSGAPEPDAAAAVPASFRCGPGGCTPAGSAAETDAPAGDEPQAEPTRTLLMCPTCDEPFEPEYPRVCEWCGHEFPDGFQVEIPQEPLEQIDSRVYMVVFGLLALGVALVAYFMFIV